MYGSYGAYADSLKKWRTAVMLNPPVAQKAAQKAALRNWLECFFNRGTVALTDLSRRDSSHKLSSFEASSSAWDVVSISYLFCYINVSIVVTSSFEDLIAKLFHITELVMTENWLVILFMWHKESICCPVLYIRWYHAALWKWRFCGQQWKKNLSKLLF